jgi:threonylcarbamoyladenosine tRNA methylthiotransferase CDKAL1
MQSVMKELSREQVPQVSPRRRRSVCIAFAEGCPRNRCDTAWLFRYFEANGWTLVRRPRRADLVVVATCGFDMVREEKSIRLLHQLDKTRSKDAQLVVVGCLAGIHPERIDREFQATVIAPGQVERLNEVIDATVRLAQVPPVNDVDPYIEKAQKAWLPSERYPGMSRRAALKQDVRATVRAAAHSLLAWCRVEAPVSRLWHRLKRQLGRGTPESEPMFFIRVARGCGETCSYCAIRFAVGPLQSRPLDDILAQFDQGLRQGYRLFNLVADDIGPYGADIGSSLAELLAGVFARRGDFRLVLTDINPRYMIRYASEVTEILAANSSRIELLKVPIQSGSDRMLQLMERPYTLEQLRRCLGELREQAPELPLDTHILVGFPGETEADFQKTVDLLRAVRFDRIQAYWYSDRPNTPAAQMTPKVPDSVIERRVRTLLREFPGRVYSYRPVPEKEPVPCEAASTPSAPSQSGECSSANALS